MLPGSDDRPARYPQRRVQTTHEGDTTSRYVQSELSHRFGLSDGEQVIMLVSLPAVI